MGRHGLFIVLSVTLLTQTAFATEWVAHRGASHDAPENTLAAFRLAWQQNADAIEGDFQLTKDKKIVCLHDRTTKRTAGVDLSVAQSTFAELRTLDVGSWKGPQFSKERIPTLGEVLATVPAGKKILIEVKCGPEIAPFLKKELADANFPADQTVIIAFNAHPMIDARFVKAFQKAGYEFHVWTVNTPDGARRMMNLGVDSITTNRPEFLRQALDH